MSEFSVDLSIIIPCYNVERYISECLDSVLTQSLSNIEVICVDDGSDDNTVSIIQEYIKKDSRVSLLTQKNQHAGVARNLGLSVAKGKYIHFLDSDDYVLNYAYEAIINKCEKYNLDTIRFCSVALDNESKKTIRDDRCTLSKLRPGDFNRLIDINKENVLFNVQVAPWAGIYRKDFLDEIHASFNDLRCVNDRSFFNKTITNAKRIMCSLDTLVVYRVNQSKSLIGVRAYNFDCQFKSISITEKQLLLDNISSSTAERLMEREFIDLFMWGKKYAFNAEIDKNIQKQIKNYVQSYDGKFKKSLIKCYNSYLKERKTLDVKSTAVVSSTVIPFFHERSLDPKISIIVPTMNVEDYLNLALDSLTKQDMEDLEFIVLNDGSTDESMTIINEYANVDKRFIVVDKLNSGYGATMNMGLDMSRGKYVGILEPDDFVAKNMYSTLFFYAENNNLDFVKSNFNRFVVNPDGSLGLKFAKLTDDLSYFNKVVDVSNDINTFKFVMNTWTGIYNSKFLKENNIRHNETPGASYQDNGFWFKTFCLAHRGYFLSKSFYFNRRDNPNSSMLSKKKEMCITEEYSYIYDWLKSDPELLKKYEQIFYVKKFDNFKFTYSRLEESRKLSYLHHIKDEFEKPLKEGLLDESLFSKTNWDKLNSIIENPELYYEKICVSVIIPVYNGEKYIRQCLASILFRNEHRIEVICVDDGSTDSTLSILKEYEAKDSRVKVLSQKNAGPGVARNNGLKLAKGEYVSFLDADDFFENNIFDISYAIAEEKDLDVIVFPCDQYFEKTKSFAKCDWSINKKLLPTKKVFSSSDVSRDFFKLFIGWPWDKLFRLSFIKELNLEYPSLYSSEDLPFVFAALCKAQRIGVYHSQVLCHHRKSELSSSVSSSRDSNYDSCFKALCILRNQLVSWDLFSHFENDFINYSLHFLLWNLFSLKGKAFSLMYDDLKHNWLSDLSVNAKDNNCFYYKTEYKSLCNLVNSVDALDFLKHEVLDQVSYVKSFAKKNFVKKNSLREFYLCIDKFNNLVNSSSINNTDSYDLYTELLICIEKIKQSFNEIRKNVKFNNKFVRIIFSLPSKVRTFNRLVSTKGFANTLSYAMGKIRRRLVR